jgi:hypothetical protein
MRQQQLRWFSTALSHCCTRCFRRDLDPGGFSSTGGIFNFKDMTEAIVLHGCEAYSVIKILDFSIWLHLVLWIVTHVSEEHTASVFWAKLEKPGFSETLGLSIRMYCIVFQKPIMLKHTAVRIPGLA